MKLQMCLVLGLVVGCGVDPFVTFVDGPSYTEDGGDSVVPQEEDAGSGVVRDTDAEGAQDTGAGGAPMVEKDALVATGGRSVTGTGGQMVASGGTPVVGAGGSMVAEDAGASPVDACVHTTHTSGVSSTWQDCVPLGTYNKEQAIRACEASGAPECRATNCGVGNLIVCGYKESYVYGCWGYAGELTGYAKERSDSCSGFDWAWG